MKELKNLIRIIAAAVALSLPYSAQAQILDMSVNLSLLHLTDDFLRSMYYCKPYEGERSVSNENVKVRTVYHVLGMREGKCQIKVEGFSNTSVHITQYCSLTPEQAKEYADSLSKYQVKKYSPRFDEKLINADPNYQKAVSIMNDPDTCTIIRDRIDNTHELRAKLPNCEPIKSSEEIMDSVVKRVIVGKTDSGLCKFLFTLWMPKPDTSFISPIAMDKFSQTNGEVKDVEFKYECLWNKALQKEYFNILNTYVIPEELGYDFSAIERPNSWEEMDFIIRNCSYVPDMK